MPIHPTAIIDRQAEIHPTADIGPYAVIEGPVRIGAGTRVRAHAFLSGWTEIGEQCDIHPYAVVGHYPQDFHYSGERSYTRIGNRVVIREMATVHRGTQPESATVIGDECFLLATAHIGHNCILGRGVKVYNGALVAGHVEIDEGVTVSGNAVIHQFVRIGRYAYLGGAARVPMDVCPFMTVVYDRVVQYNRVGMLRNGWTQADVNDIRQAYRVLFRSRHAWPRAVAMLAETLHTPAGRILLDFLKAPSRRGYLGGLRTSRGGMESAAE